MTAASAVAALLTPPLIATDGGLDAPSSCTELAWYSSVALPARLLRRVSGKGYSSGSSSSLDIPSVLTREEWADWTYGNFHAM